MANFIVIAIVALMVGLAVRHIYMQKKRGVKCIGCSGGCSGGCSCCSGCRGNTKSNETLY